jgi:hypothetical protein
MKNKSLIAFRNEYFFNTRMYGNKERGQPQLTSHILIKVLSIYFFSG